MASNIFRIFTFPSARHFNLTGDIEYLKTLIQPFGLYILEWKDNGIQGVPGGKDLTSGECSLGQTIPI